MNKWDELQFSTHSPPAQPLSGKVLPQTEISTFYFLGITRFSGHGESLVQILKKRYSRAVFDLGYKCLVLN